MGVAIENIAITRGPNGPQAFIDQLESGWRKQSRRGTRRIMKPKVLIVDDDVAITQQLFWMLCDDYEVMTANDLTSAVRRATIYEPVLSILDLHLPPTLNSADAGLRIIEYIKGHFPKSKVFVISSAATADVQKACIKSGADGFLSKPLDIEKLLTTVRGYMAAHQHDAA
jgi:DNA-binding NtrC family response regulator